MAFCAKDLKGLSAGQKLDIYLIIINRPKIAIEKTILVLVFITVLRRKDLVNYFLSFCEFYLQIFRTIEQNCLIPLYQKNCLTTTTQLQ